MMLLRKLQITTVNDDTRTVSGDCVELQGDTLLEMTVVFPNLDHNTATDIANVMLAAARGELT